MNEKKNFKVVFLQMKRILLAQQVHMFLLEFHAEKKKKIMS